MKQAHSHYIHVVKGVKRKMKRFVRKITNINEIANVSSGIGVRGFGDVTGEPKIEDQNPHIERITQNSIENSESVRAFVKNNTFGLYSDDYDGWWEDLKGMKDRKRAAVKSYFQQKNQTLKEEMSGGNSAGGGAIAGLGVTPEGKPSNFGEPGVNRAKTKYKKKNKQQTPIMQDAINRRLPQPMFEVKRGMFAGNETFIVPESVFNSARMAKKEYKHWTKYLQETDYGRAISAHAKKNRKKPIILQCERTGYMCYAKYGSK